VKVQAKQLVTFNKWATLAWVILIAPTLLWWKESILWVALMSIWANIVGHFSAWIAARSERASKGTGTN
jgi:hypothetical protein